MSTRCPLANTSCGQESGTCVTSVENVNFINGNPSGGPTGIPRGAGESPGTRMKIYAGLDGAEQQVLEFIDLVASRGQFDLLAGAKVSFDDADAVLVREG